MPVQTVFLNLEAGMSPREITEEFDVTLDEINAVLQKKPGQLYAKILKQNAQRCYSCIPQILPGGKKNPSRSFVKAG